MFRSRARRQKQLEELAERFERKARLRETWLESNQRLVETENFGSDLPTVEVRLNESCSTDSGSV